MASRMLDLPLSPGPMRQFTPFDGVQSSACIERKLRISSLRMRVMFVPALSDQYRNSAGARRWQASCGSETGEPRRAHNLGQVVESFSFDELGKLGRAVPLERARQSADVVHGGDDLAYPLGFEPV